MKIFKRILKQLFRKHYKKLQLIERIVQYGQDVEFFFTNYERVLIDAGLASDIKKLKQQSRKILEDMKDLFRVY